MTICLYLSVTLGTFRKDFAAPGPPSDSPSLLPRQFTIHPVMRNAQNIFSIFNLLSLRAPFRDPEMLFFLQVEYNAGKIGHPVDIHWVCFIE
jgi:hypothetical protein